MSSHEVPKELILELYQAYKLAAVRSEGLVLSLREQVVKYTEENAALKKELEKLREQVVKYTEENAALKKLEKLKPTPPAGDKVD